MEILNPLIQQVKIPSANDNIYSEECVFSFDTPVKPEFLEKPSGFLKFQFVGDGHWLVHQFNQFLGLRKGLR